MKAAFVSLSLFVVTALTVFGQTSLDNSLTSKEQKEGWALLIDGSTSKGWRAYSKDDFPETWKIIDKTLYSGGSQKGIEGDGDDIITLKRYQNFVLSLEWKIAEGGNSSIFYLCQKKEDVPIYKSNLQMQILDNERNEDAKKGKDGNRMAGSLWDIFPAVPQNTKPAGKWNKVDIIVNKGKVIHDQNGKNVVEYNPWTDEWRKMISESSLKDNPDMIIPVSKGYNGLQEHGAGVWLRILRLKSYNFFRKNLMSGN